MNISGVNIVGGALSSAPTPPPTNTCGPSGNGIYPPQTVTASLLGGTVWGTNPYTDDSDFARAVVHAGLATPGQTVTILKTSVGNIASFGGSTQNGVTTTPYPAPWCGVTIALLP